MKEPVSEKRVITTEWVQTTPEEYREVYFHLHRKRVMRWTFVGLLGLAIAIGGVFLSKPYAVMFGIGVMAVGFGDVLAMRWHVQRLTANSAHARAFKPARAIVDEEKIILEDQLGERNEIPWNQFVAIEKFKDDYLLYLSRFSYVHMFRRAQFEDDWLQFVAWVEAQPTNLPTS